MTEAAEVSAPTGLERALLSYDGPGLPYAETAAEARSPSVEAAKNSWISAVSRSGASWADQWLPRSYSFHWTMLLWSRSATAQGVKS
jgi:hypothetical protein